MSLAVYDSAIAQGSDWYINFQYEDSNGVPINLNGYTGKMQFRSLPNDPIVALTLDSAQGIDIVGYLGLIKVHATANQTGSMSAGYYYYDLEVTAPTTNIVTRIIQGQFQINPQVTR